MNKFIPYYSLYRLETKNCTCTTCKLEPMGQVDEEQDYWGLSQDRKVLILDTINLKFHNFWPEDHDDDVTMLTEYSVKEMDQPSPSATAFLS